MIHDRSRCYRRVPRQRGHPRNAAPAAAPPRRRSHAFKLALLVFVQYALLAADIRFVAAANYPGIAITNVCIAINTWYLTRGIIAATSTFDRLCYVVGGTTGALLAVVATQYAVG